MSGLKGGMELATAAAGCRFSSACGSVLMLASFLLKEPPSKTDNRTMEQRRSQVGMNSCKDNDHKQLDHDNVDNASSDADQDALPASVPSLVQSSRSSGMGVD